MNIALYIHQGLGDAIVCNSLIRSFCKNNKHVTLFCKVPYFESINYLLRDIQNITIIPINEENIENYVQQNENNFDSYIKIGFHNLNSHEEFDKQMYRQAGIPHETRWSDFTFKRNKQAEDIIYNYFIKSEEPYIFLHEDVSRDFIINRSFIKNKNIKIIEPTHPTDNIFLYAKLIENAQEVHCIDSSFLNLTEHLQPKGTLYYHKYARPPHCSHPPCVKNDWNILHENTTKGNIALLTYHTLDDHVIAYCEITKNNKIEYSLKHGYDFYNFNKMNDNSLPPEWSKFVYSQKLLDKYNWLFWTDADSLITNQQIKAESIIDDNYDVISSTDACGLNTGTFFIKNSEFSKILLNTLLQIRKDYNNNIEYTKKIPTLGEGKLSDQDALAFLIITNWNNCRSRIKLIDKKQINSYFFKNESFLNDWQPGHFIMHLPGTHKRKEKFLKVLPYIKK